jgi:hypothetical protein
MSSIIQTIAGLKSCLNFILHLIALAALYAMSLNDIDTSNIVPMVLLSYSGTQAAKQISAHQAASRDPDANTAEVIKEGSEK